MARRPLSRLLVVVSGVAALMASIAGLVLAAGSAGIDTALKEKWEKKWTEQQTRGFTMGTIDEFIDETPRGSGSVYRIISRKPASLTFASSRLPGRYFVLYEIKSVQGRSLLLGPVLMPEYRASAEEYFKIYLTKEPAIAFDETKNYSALYYDQLNRGAMFVIRERRKGGDVPIQALYYPKHVKTPNLVDDKTNEELKLKGFLTTVVPLTAKSLLPQSVQKLFDQK